MERRCVWNDLAGQTRVASFLERVVTDGRVSHAYLFVGPSGSGKKTAARALACALFCDDGGCGACGICRRVKSGVHPDLTVVRPEGAATYMVEQIREIIHEVGLTPVQASRKVVVFEDADAFNAESANAFLKTLEEPPADTVLVLLARDYDAVLPTISSRCQVVRFAPIPPSVAVGLVVQRTGAGDEEARAALSAASGVVGRAVDIVRSPGRREVRDLMLDVLGRLSAMDAADVLDGAKTVLTAAKAPVEELKVAQAAEIEDQREFLGKQASTRHLEVRHKRELTARERDGVSEVLAVIEGWLRDCLLESQGAEELVASADAIEQTRRVGAEMSPEAAVRALESVAAARRRISYNVSPQLACEALLFDIQEVLRCPR